MEEQSVSTASEATASVTVAESSGDPPAADPGVELADVLVEDGNVDQGNEEGDVLSDLQPEGEQDRVYLTQRSLDDIPSVLDWEEVSSEASDAINNVVGNIMERMRVERMFELRRIQHGDRAVSSGERAQQLEGLFNQEPAEIARRAPGSEGIRGELENLARNQSVGNLLNTRFRALLENSLSAPPVPPHMRPREARRAPPAAPYTAPPRAPSTGPPRAPPAPRAAAPGPQQDYRRAPPLPEEVEYAPPDYDERQFDYAISDVEELFQRRLVSDVLHSAFRNVLELHIERRLVRAGVEPRNRETAVQRRQDTAIERHRQLNIHPRHFQEQQRAPQMGLPQIGPGPSASRRIPEIERQVHAMSVELKEMKVMLRLLVDTQLDVQRSIRQEVNAMMSSATVVPNKPTKQLKEGQCVVCLELPCDTVLYRCGHLCCCFGCARLLRVEGHHCPVCRANVTDIMRVYRSTGDVS